jgi:hypothetical protein
MTRKEISKTIREFCKRNSIKSGGIWFPVTGRGIIKAPKIFNDKRKAGYRIKVWAVFMTEASIKNLIKLMISLGGENIKQIPIPNQYGDGKRYNSVIATFKDEI